MLDFDIELNRSFYALNLHNETFSIFTNLKSLVMNNERTAQATKKLFPFMPKLVTLLRQRITAAHLYNNNRIQHGILV